MTNEHQTEREEAEIARLLRAAGPREQLPDDLKRGWEQVFRAGLAARATRRRRRRRVFTAALVAGIATLALGLWALRPADDDAPVIRVSAVTGAIEIAGQPAIAGRRLIAGTAIETGSDQRIAIAWAGYDLRIDARTQVVLGIRDVELRRGRIYASDSEHGIGKFQLVVSTPRGEVRDIGTQFTVVVDDSTTMATVRRGAIVLETRTGRVQTRAEADAATQVAVDAGGGVTTRQVRPSGSDWEWIYAASPGYAIDGKSVHEFLSWASGESGARLEFTTAAAELYARRTTLHGTSRQTDPGRALATVLEATDLVAAQKDDTLRVSLRRHAGE